MPRVTGRRLRQPLEHLEGLLVLPDARVEVGDPREHLLVRPAAGLELRHELERARAIPPLE